MVAQPMEFHSPAERVIERTPFLLDDEMLTAIKPKGGQLLALAKEIRAMGDTDPLGQAEVVDKFMDLCMEPASRDRINERLGDADDPFDVDVLTQIITRLQEKWTDRPTGPSPASSRRRKQTGRPSTARVRSTA